MKQTLLEFFRERLTDADVEAAERGDDDAREDIEMQSKLADLWEQANARHAADESDIYSLGESNGILLAVMLLVQKWSDHPDFDPDVAAWRHM